MVSPSKKVLAKSYLKTWKVFFIAFAFGWCLKDIIHHQWDMSNWFVIIFVLGSIVGSQIENSAN